MRVIIDRKNCVSCGSCWDTCPELFEQNPLDSFSQIAGQFRSAGNPAEGTIPSEQEACAAEAAGLCPVQVIRTEG